MIKREIRRTTEKYGRILEPFQVFLLMLLFTIPVVAVLNLSPQTGTQPIPEDNVLGVNTSENPEVIEVGGTHQFIQSERLTTDDNIVYLYQATAVRRDSGIYSKPIIVVTNPSEEEIIVRFSLVGSEASSTQIGVMANSTNYIVRDIFGESFIREFNLGAGEEQLFYLDVRNDDVTNFDENIDIRIDTRFANNELEYLFDDETELNEENLPIDENEPVVEKEEPEIENTELEQFEEESIEEELPLSKEETEAIIKIAQ